jgi:hypothetical protein
LLKDLFILNLISGEDVLEKFPFFAAGAERVIPEQ